MRASEYVLGLVCSEYLVGSVHHVDPQDLPGSDAAKWSSSVPQFQMLQGRKEPWEPMKKEKDTQVRTYKSKEN